MSDHLTLPQLAARWGCSTATALARVRDLGVPFVWMGPGDPDLGGRGRKPLLFRLESVERWERAREVVAEAPAAAGPAKTRKPARPACWDGKSRMPGLKGVG